MGNDTRNAPIFEDIFQFFSKTKGLGENLTIPRDAIDIFPSEITNKSSKSRFVFNTEAKQFGKTRGVGSGSQRRRAIHCRSA